MRFLFILNDGYVLIRKMCQKSKNAILSVKCQCFDTPKQFAELPCAFRDISFLLQNTCFNSQGPQNTKKNKAVCHLISNSSECQRQMSLKQQKHLKGNFFLSEYNYPMWSNSSCKFPGWPTASDGPCHIVLCLLHFRDDIMQYSKELDFDVNKTRQNTS